MDLTGLDLKARGVLLTLLFLCDDDGECNIQVRGFARENGLSHQQIRTIISRLQTTQWITQLTTQSATQRLTHLKLNKSLFCADIKHTQQHKEQHKEQHRHQHKDITELPIEKCSVKKLKKIEEADIDFEGFMRFFNETMNGTKIPKIQKMTDIRKANLSLRCKEHGKKKVMEVIKTVPVTPFLCGDNEMGWTANYDWIFNPKNFLKIMEGNYNEQRDNSSGRGPGTASIEGIAGAIYRLNHG